MNHDVEKVRATVADVRHVLKAASKAVLQEIPCISCQFYRPVLRETNLSLYFFFEMWYNFKEIYHFITYFL